jgi:hypothetical protein
MADVGQLVGAARRSALQLVARASALLAHGAGLQHVQDDYVVAALELLEDAEAYGVLAAGGDRDAVAVIEHTIRELDALHRKLSRELAERDQADGDR